MLFAVKTILAFPFALSMLTFGQNQRTEHSPQFRVLSDTRVTITYAQALHSDMDALKPAAQACANDFRNDEFFAKYSSFFFSAKVLKDGRLSLEGDAEGKKNEKSLEVMSTSYLIIDACIRDHLAKVKTIPPDSEIPDLVIVVQF